MIMELKDICKIYGPGCKHCLESCGADFDSSICPHCGSVVALNRINLHLKKGEILGIVGESGSGKSTLLKLIYQDEKATGGILHLEQLVDELGHYINLLEADENILSFVRDKIMAMIYQNPMLGLNYQFSAGGNIAEKIIMSGEKHYEKIRKRALYFLDKTEIPTERIDDYPDRFSGGQQQRIQISKALSCNPKILLLDEPTTGLDLSVQAKILDLIKVLQKEIGFAMIIVSHDLGVIRHLTDICVVMKNGEIVEYGLTDQILEDPGHPYTQTLVSSIL